MTVEAAVGAREHARSMFYHALDSYMRHAYPWDELKPLSCEGRRWDRRERGTLDDSLGGFQLTLVDSLDMLAVLGDWPRFRREVHRVSSSLSFDRDVTVSVYVACPRRPRAQPALTLAPPAASRPRSASSAAS